MNNAYILLSNIQVEGGSHQLLHNLTCSQVNVEVFVLVNDFEKISPLQLEFPTVIFLLLDTNRNVDVNKGCLRLLPDMECYLNYSGEVFAGNLKQITEILISKESSYSYDALTLQIIHDDLRGNDGTGTVLINPAPSPKAKGICGILKNVVQSSSSPSPPAASTSTSTAATANEAQFEAQFRTGAKYRRPLQSSRSSTNERQPLLPKRSIQDDKICQNGFFSCLFCFCYPYCCTESPESFDSPQQLYSHLRMSQTADIRRSLRNLMERMDEEWQIILHQLSEKERLKIEELVLKVQEKKDIEEGELEEKKDAENKSTVENLTGVLDDDVIKKIAKSRERQLKKKVIWDTEKSYSLGNERIKKAAEMEKNLKKDEHYSKVLLKQFNIMQNIKDKYDRRLERLMNKYFKRGGNNII